MDTDRSHFRTTSSGSSSTTSELFICFTSRLSSSSSMKLSKSILSPGRAARDGGPTTLSSSLSRRLRTNGSLKGGQASPFFTTTGKKRGCAFENPEPSSPKVTCIGQVRVKTKKKVKQTRSLSKRRTGGAAAEVSFRKIEQTSGDGGDDKASTQQQRYSNASSAHYAPPQECLPHRNQRWVHLPISICEALRTFGAEFSCLLPCRSSCFSTAEREKMEKQNGNGGENGCGAVFRWLVAVNEDEGVKGREIELVLDGRDEEEEERVSARSSRRHVFEDIEVKDGNRIELKGQSLEREDESGGGGGRVSICIPPKNALLLMRCRSDPIKMAALVNRSTSNNDEPQHNTPIPIHQQQEDDIEEEEEEEEEEIVVDGDEQCVRKDESLEPEIADSVETTVIANEVEEEDELKTEGDGKEVEISSEEMAIQEKTQMLFLEILEKTFQEEEEEEEVESNMSSFEDLLEEENAEEFQEDEEEPVEEDTPVCHLSPSSESDEEVEEEDLHSNESPPLLLQEPAAAIVNITQESSNSLQELVSLANEEENQEAETTAAGDEDEDEEDDDEEEELVAAMPKPEETQGLVTDKKGKEGPLLPECLLLMMCEPKLSMEVSKETWVCSTDFTRWLPERPRRAAAAAAKPCDRDPVNKRRLSIDSKPKPAVQEPHQPPRSSCSLPVATAAAASMATMLEQKLVNAVGYEPFVLTRCKSEPMKTAAAKLMPESCFWKNAVRKLEPHRCAAMGVGAAGVGF